MSNSSPRFSSRFAFLVSALGIAVGTGNIWRFPRIAASNGGDDGAGERIKMDLSQNHLRSRARANSFDATTEDSAEQL